MFAVCIISIFWAEILNFDGREDLTAEIFVIGAYLELPSRVAAFELFILRSVSAPKSRNTKQCPSTVCRASLSSTYQ